MGLLLLVTVLACLDCGVSISQLWEGMVKGFSFLAYMFPPDWSAFGEMLQPVLESIVIAVLGTSFGTFLSLIFAVFAASNLTHPWIRQITRFLIGFERSIPEIIILLILVAAFGLGAMPAIIALTLGCIGMLGKLLADTIEEIDSVMLDSMTSVGANKLQVVFYGILPQILPNLVTYALFRLEINIRLSVILGAVGAGGIGYELEYAFNMLNYHRAMTAFLLILLMVLGTEQVSNLVKKRIKGREVLL